MRPIWEADIAIPASAIASAKLELGLYRFDGQIWSVDYAA
jgi:hypothetical protein